MSDAVQKPNKVSREGVVLIKSFEGFRPRAVQRADGRWVIGYGHTLSAREGLSVSEGDAELLLQYDLLPVVKTIQDDVRIPLNQHQFDALASFAFSVGVDRFRTSDVLARINAGAPSAAADALMAWPEDVQTPPRRRAAERALFVAPSDVPVALADLLLAPLLPFPAQDVANDDAPEQPSAAVPAWTSGVSAHQFYSPYSALAAAPLGAVAPFPANVEIAPRASDATGPDTATVPADAAASSTPVEPLMLTTHDGFTPPSRVVWPDDVSAEPEPQDGLLEGAPVETEARDAEPVAENKSRRFDWRETGAFLSMGGIGLVSFGAAMAAFRHAGETRGGDALIIGWVLAVIALACVTVSGYNLYQGWGRADRA